MTLAMKVLLRVVKRRVEGGEALPDILTDYPRLSETDRNVLVAELNK